MKRISIYSAVLGLLSLLTYSCCGVYDDLGNCPQDLCIRFYNQTSCDTDRHPERLNDLNHATLAFYDQSGQLVQTVATKLSTTEGTDGWKYIVTRAPKAGKYKMVCWTTSNIKAFETENLKKGTQAKDEIWKLSSSFNLDNNIPPVFYGGEDVEIIDHSEDGTVTDTLNMNLSNYRHKIDFSVRGLVKEYNYSIQVVDSLSQFDFNGNPKDALLTFNRNLTMSEEVVSGEKDGKVVRWASSFNIFRLDRSDEFKNKRPHIKIIEHANGADREVCDFDLIKLIDKLNLVGQTMNFDCFPTIKIDIKLDAYMLVAVSINGWNVVLTEHDLKN